MIRFLLRLLLRLLYRVEVSGIEHYQVADERLIIIANHTSLLDGVLLFAWLPGKPVFAINSYIAERFHWCRHFAELFPIDTNSPFAIKSMIRLVNEGRKLVIFPEGRITMTGAVMKVYPGPALIAERTGAPVLRIAIDGAQFSPFSHLGKKGLVRWFPKIRIVVLPACRLVVEASDHRRRKQATLQLQDMMHELQYAAFNHRQSVFSAFSAAVSRYGYRRHIVSDSQGRNISYGQCLRQALVLARVVQQQTERGEFVGILLPNITPILPLFLAMQYAGRVPVMLNFAAGRSAVINACKTAHLKTVYTSQQFISHIQLENLPEVRLIYLEDMPAYVSLFAKLIATVRSIRPPPGLKVDVDSPAVVLFTSGSEATAKGVVLSHSNLLANYAQVRCHIDFTPQDLVFTCLPVFHSFGLNAGLLMPLLGGSRVFLYPTPLHYRNIPELVYTLQATILFGSNTFLRGYARHAHEYDFHSLRYVVAGAEKLHKDTQQLWMQKFGIRIYQGYGVTETSPVFSVNTPLANKLESVGRKIPMIDFYLQPIDGIKKGGQLFVRGPNIMLGYLLQGNDGGVIPPCSERGQGWHDTGDIAEVDEDGFFYILGRVKRFAKIAGEMISLGTVEELATQLWPTFNHAAVCIPDPHKGERIILVSENPEATRNELRQYIRQRQHPELLVAAKIISTAALPALGNGKVDYLSLQKQVEADSNTP